MTVQHLSSYSFTVIDGYTLWAIDCQTNRIIKLSLNNLKSLISVEMNITVASRAVKITNDGDMTMVIDMNKLIG